MLDLLAPVFQDWKIMIIVCPLSQGKKSLHAHVNYGFNPALGTCEHEWKDVTCLTCEGTGTITEEHVQRIDKGKILRQERVASGELLFNAAKRLGLSSAQLSAIESGRILGIHGKNLCHIP